MILLSCIRCHTNVNKDEPVTTRLSKNMTNVKAERSVLHERPKNRVAKSKMSFIERKGK